MSSDSGRTTSIWMETVVPVFPPLAANTQADVCVIGAGIAGLSTAFLLARSGKSVIVLEDGRIGGGETGRTTAHLTTALDDRYYELEHLHGSLGAQLAAESHAAAIDQIEAIVVQEGIDCEFERVDGYLFGASEDAIDLLTRELAAAQRAGLSGVALLPRGSISALGQSSCLKFPRQAQFHPLKYLNGLARLIQRMGGVICTQTHAASIQDGAPVRVMTSSGLEVQAGAVVIATNAPINDRIAISAKQAAYRTYVIGVEVPKGSVPTALYWDTLDPYHYIRLANAADPGNRTTELLIVGGEDHKTGQADDEQARFARLETWTREHFPMSLSVQYRWSGQVLEPIDGLAYIGLSPGEQSSIFIATGDSGNGMTHGTIAGMLLTDLILGRENPWTKLYNPSRVTLRAAKEFIEEGLNTAAQLTDWVTPGMVNTPDEVAAGTGAIMGYGLAKVAVFRDENNRVHEYAAECPHLGCIVDWNTLERTWDCPCHGSRFDAYGKVINGPANSDLKPREPKA